MNKLSLFGIFIFIATLLFLNSALADVTLSPTSSTVNLFLGETRTDIKVFDIAVDSDLTNIKLNFSDFTNSDNEKVDVTFNFPSSILANQSGEVKATFTSSSTMRLEEEISRVITVTGTQNGTTVSETFTLNLNVRSPHLRIELEDEDDLEDLEPGKDFKVTLNVDNIANFPELDNSDIKDIEIDVEIINIEGGEDDLKEEASKFDLDEGDDDDIEIDFTVPLNTEEDDYDMVLTVRGELDDNNQAFRFKKIFRGVVEVVKDEDEEIQFDNVDISPATLSCGSNLIVDSTAVNTGEDDLDENDIEVRLIIETRGTPLKTIIEDRFTDFDNELEGDGASDDRDREEDIRFSVSLPNDLDQESYSLRLVARFENSVVGSHVEIIQASPCVSPGDQVDTDEEDRDIPPTTTGNGTVFLPTSFAVAGLDRETWTTIFWILGDLVLLIVAIYFIVLIFRKR